MEMHSVTYFLPLCEDNFIRAAERGNVAQPWRVPSSCWRRVRRVASGPAPIWARSRRRCARISTRPPAVATGEAAGHERHRAHPPSRSQIGDCELQPCGSIIPACRTC